MITGGGGGNSTPAVAFGTAAARPAAAAGNAATAYYATDTGELTVSNGAAWSTLNQVSGSAFRATGNLISQGTLYLPSGPLDIQEGGQGLKVAEGSNAKQGTATLAGGTVTVTNTSVTATSRIFLTPQDNNTSGALRVSARTAGTSFTITSSNAADTGVVAWEIFEQG